MLSAPYLKQRVAAGERLIGAGIFTDSPDVIEYAAVGMDWVWWECQHTHGTWQNTVHGEGVEAAEAIARVPGVDALHVGGRDLAVRLGLTATEYDAYRQVEREMERVVRACKTAGKAAAAVTLTEAAMEQAVAQGYTLICAGFDLDHLEADYRRMREALGRIGAP